MCGKIGPQELYYALYPLVVNYHEVSISILPMTAYLGIFRLLLFLHNPTGILNII